MKKILTVIVLASAVFLTSCEKEGSCYYDVVQYDADDNVESTDKSQALYKGASHKEELSKSATVYRISNGDTTGRTEWQFKYCD